MKAKIIYFRGLLPLILSALILSSCGQFAPSEETEEITYHDESGITVSLRMTRRPNGSAVALSAEPEGEYLYSADLGLSYKKLNSEEEIAIAAPKSCSFRLMKADDPETVTDILTVYAGGGENTLPVRIVAVSRDETGTDGGSITLKAEYTGGAKSLAASADGGESWHDFTGNTAVFDGLSAGMYNVCVREKGSTDDTHPVLNVPVLRGGIGQGAFIDVESILQNPELPTGCEAVSLTMLLGHIGFDADKLTVADDYLPKGDYRKADFGKVFVGDPHERSAYGCTAAVICETAEKYLADNDPDRRFRVRNVTGASPAVLYGFLDSRIPVIVWASIDMGEITESSVIWRDSESGELVFWPGNEHCLLLTGYDMTEGLVYVNDPLRGKTSYGMELFEKRYEQMERNAVIITENR
ncbi:MAG: C39 family peptidase [Ruminococcus sp.]|nr:C39 family peptidase [Ruminococcus sp.]